MQAYPFQPKPPSEIKPEWDRPDWVTRETRLPNGEIRRERYDFAGRVQRVDEPDGSWLRFKYLSGRLVKIEHSSGESVVYSYDSDEVAAKRGRCQSVIRRDNRGYPEAINTNVDGVVFEVEYQRDERGRVSAIRYPWVRTLPACLASDNPLMEEEHAGSVRTQGWLRFENGRVYCDGVDYLTVETDRARTSVKFANGASVVEEFEGESPKRIAHLDSKGLTVLSLDYETDEQGRIIKAGEQSFDYDADGALRIGRKPARGNLEYDRLGRLIRRDDPEGPPQSDPDSPTVANSERKRLTPTAPSKETRIERR